MMRCMRDAGCRGSSHSSHCFTMDNLFGDDAWGEEPDWVKLGTDRSKEGSSDDNDAEDGAAPLVLGAQHVLLLVDCHADMFAALDKSSQEGDNNHDDGISCPADLALKLAQQLMQRRIRDTVTLKIGKRNGVGVLLFDTKPLQDPPNNKSCGEDNNNEELPHQDDEDDEEEDDETPARHVHVLLPLDPPGITQVQTIRACLKGDRNVKEEFAANNKINEEGNDDAPDAPRIAPLQTALEEAVRIFRQASCVREKASKPTDPLDTRCIWILTNRDDPYGSTNNNNPELLQNVARDAKESGIQIMVWPLARPSSVSSASCSADSSFSMDPLYGEVVSQHVFEDRRLGTVEAIEEGLEDLQQYWKKIRRLYWGPMLLPGENVRGGARKMAEDDNDNVANEQDDDEAPHIMVDWFRFVQMAKKPATVQIDQQTKRGTIKLKQYLDKNGEIFATIRMGDVEDRKKPKGGLKRIRQFATFGSERIPMPNEDLDEIRLQANGGKAKASLSILGFKPKDSIPWYHAMDQAYLIYPNDEVVKGSREAFVELHAAMLRKQVLAVGEVLHRVQWSSRLVAIYPIEEAQPLSDESGESPDSGPRSPPGMIVVTLPFEDDIRTLEEDEAWQAWVQQISSPCIKQEIPDEVPSVDLENAGDLQMPSDPLIQSAINLISRQRLVGMELGEDFENAALTDFFNYLENVALEIAVPEQEEIFDTRTDDAMIVEAVGGQIEDFREKLPEDVQISKSMGTRKRKMEPVKDDTGLDWQDLYISGELDMVKIPQLKSYLRSAGAPLSGNKSLLVERVSDLIKKSMAGSSSDKFNVKSEP